MNLKVLEQGVKEGPLKVTIEVEIDQLATEQYSRQFGAETLDECREILFFDLQEDPFFYGKRLLEETLYEGVEITVRETL